MTEHKNVYVALAAAQSEMESVVKGSVNPAFKSRYAALDDVVQVVRPALNKHGIAYLHQIITDERGSVMRTLLVHGASETEVHCDVPLIVDRNNMQGFKSATTYAKRIGVESLTGIAPQDDDDGNAAAKAAPVTEDRPAKPKADPSKAVGEACAYLAGAADLSDLQARWNNIPTAVKADARVIEAKDAAKAALQSAPAPANADLEDSIPY